MSKPIRHNSVEGKVADENTSDNNKMTNLSSRSLVQSLKKGDPCAFDRLVEQKDLQLKGFLFKLLRSKEDAEEIAQDVFIHIWQKRDYLSEDKSLDAFLFHIARGRAIDRLREIDRLRSLLRDEYHHTPANYADSPEEIAEQNEIQARIDRIVESMPPVMQRIYTMKMVEGQSNNEIADQLSITPSSVRTQLERAFKKVYSAFNVSYPNRAKDI